MTSAAHTRFIRFAHVNVIIFQRDYVYLCTLVLPLHHFSSVPRNCATPGFKSSSAVGVSCCFEGRTKCARPAVSVSFKPKDTANVIAGLVFMVRRMYLDGLTRVCSQLVFDVAFRFLQAAHKFLLRQVNAPGGDTTLTPSMTSNSSSPFQHFLNSALPALAQTAAEADAVPKRTVCIPKAQDMGLYPPWQALDAIGATGVSRCSLPQSHELDVALTERLLRLPERNVALYLRNQARATTLVIQAPGGAGNAGSATERGRGRAVHRLSACALSSPSLSLTASEAVCALSPSYGFDTRIFFFFFCLPFTGVGGTPVAERLRARGASGCDTPVSSAWPPWRSRWSPGECVS